MSARVLLVMVSLILGLDALVYGLVVPFLPTHATGLGLSVSETGALFAVSALMQVVTLLVLLRAGSRLPPGALLVGSLSGMAVAGGILALGADFVPALFAGRALLGITAGMAWSSGPALVISRCPEGARGRTIGVLLTGSAVGSLVGPPLGGVLYDLGGFRLPFVVVVGLAIILLVILRVVGGGFPTGAIEDGEATSPGALADLLARPGVPVTLAVVLLGGGAFGLVEPILPLQLTAVLGSTPLENGLVFGAAVLAYGVSAPLAGRVSDRVGRLRASAIGLGLMALGLPLLPLGETWAGLVAITVLLGVAIGFALSPTMSAMADAVDHGAAHGARDYTTVYALHGLIYAVGLFAGPGLGGQSVARFGLPATMAALAALCLVLALYGLGRGDRRPG